MFTDTHTHLYLPEFDSDREQLLKSAFEKNIQRFFLPNIDSSTVESMLSVCKNYPGKIFPIIGLHPCSVKENFEEELIIVQNYLEIHNKSAVGSQQSANLLTADCELPTKFYAVGEIGIDLYWDKTFVKQQEIAFRKQIDLAVENNLPIVIHSRNSLDEICQMLVEIRNSQSETRNSLRGIFHCFSGTIEQAEKIISFGNFKLGIGGVVTFKNSGLDKVVEQIDLKHIVLETDAPYLSPAPFRGKRNIPEYLILVAKKISEIKNISLEEVEKITTENSKEIFGI